MPRLRKAFTLAILAASMHAQVTTSTLYGVVQDSSGAVLPGAKALITNTATGVTRQATSDDRGEFAASAIPAGTYTVRIELSNFKTYTLSGLQLGASQTVRQTFALEIGQVSQNIAVTESAPLVSTETSSQSENITTQQAAELPIARRDLLNLVVQAPGTSNASVGIAGGGNIRLNGVAEGGNTVTVDGTDAVANPETRGMSQYGGQAQTSIMSLDAVAEVQVLKSVLPAEYGGVLGGEINFITKSGTNAFHGTAFDNYQNAAFFARDTFLPSTSAKPPDNFEQYGGSLGGPILRNRLFFFTTYEGYHENSGISVTANVPTQQLKNQVLAALPFQETSIVLNTLPAPTIPVNANIGQYFAAKPQKRHDNSVLAKGDAVVHGGNLSVTFNRSRPYTAQPSIFVDNSNDQVFNNYQDRVAAQYVLPKGPWVSETRYGWNQTGLNRVQAFWSVTDPTNNTTPPLDEVADRVGEISVSGLFATPGSKVLILKGRSFSAEEKLGRTLGSHNIKMGFNWGRQGGFKTAPANTIYSYLNLNQLLANTPSTVTMFYGQPPHDGHLDEYGLFVQDDWHVNSKLVLNLGLRWDFYPPVHITQTTKAAAQLYNPNLADSFLNNNALFQTLNLGPPTNPQSPYNGNYFNIAPRVGFAWSINSKTVVRGGSAMLTSPLLYTTIENQVTNPFIPQTVSWNTTQIAALGIKWPLYATSLQNTVLQSDNGQPTVYSLINPHLPNPFTIQSTIDVQRQLGGSWMLEAGYFRTDGRRFPFDLPLAESFDRQTGVFPNPLLGQSTGYYLTSRQTMVYNALQASVRKRYSHNLMLEFHYTLSRGWGDQGGTLNSAFTNSDIFVTQSFFTPFADREPLSQEARHRIAANGIYQVPAFKSSNRVVKGVFSGWQVSSSLTGNSGLPLSVQQPSGIQYSRPDFVGGDPVRSGYRQTRVYLNPAAFAAVPTYSGTNATIRPGSANPSDVRGPGLIAVNASIGRKFNLYREKVSLEIRSDWLNVLNHVNYNAPNLSYGSPTFGALTSDAGPRSGQMAARLSF
jgi:hypothetical protein